MAGEAKSLLNIICNNFNGWMFAGIFLVQGTQLFAQHDAYSKPIWHKQSAADTTNLIQAFKKGSMSGQIRQFSMATVNNSGLPNYHALALGGGIRYQTAAFHGLKLTVSGYFAFNLYSSDLGKTDESTGAKNRYEIGLYDITNPENKTDIKRLEELNLSFEGKKFAIIAGRQILNSVFINPQDGRMRPTEVSGLWANWHSAKKNWLIEGGIINRISPRSTTRWFSIAESMAIYPTGVNIEGTASGYKNMISSKGIAILDATWKPNSRFSVKVTNQLVENIFNSALLQINLSQPIKNGSLLGAVQLIRQDAVNNGGSTQPENTYFTPGQHAQVISSRLGWKNKVWQTSANYTRITKSGRYLMPREWGKDPFFTFLPRERNEGLGDVNAFMIKGTRSLNGEKWLFDIGAGLYNLPDVKNYRLNKYGLPSYGQLNASVNHHFGRWLQGLQANLLYVYKWNRGNTYNNPKFEVNKVNMSNINFILNYNF